MQLVTWMGRTESSEASRCNNPRAVEEQVANGRLCSASSLAEAYRRVVHRHTTAYRVEEEGPPDETNMLTMQKGGQLLGWLRANHGEDRS